MKDSDTRKHADDALAKTILAQFPEAFVGHAVDVGAHDGIFYSNTLLLEENGWTVLCVEANPRRADELARNRRLTVSVACADVPSKSKSFHIRVKSDLMAPLGHPDAGGSALNPRDFLKGEEWESVEVEVVTLEDLLSRFSFPKLDVLSVDTERGDADVIRGFDVGKWLPRVIVAEVFDGMDEVTNQLEPFGYNVIERLEHNNVYVR